MSEKSNVNIEKQDASIKTINLEKTRVDLTKVDLIKVNLEKEVISDAERIALMQVEIKKLRKTIAQLNEDLLKAKNKGSSGGDDDDDDDEEEDEEEGDDEGFGFEIEVDWNKLKKNLKPKYLLKTVIINIKNNATTYLISGLLAGSIASGIEALMKVRSLEDVKSITSTMKDEAMKEIDKKIENTSEELNEKLETVEKVSSKLEETQSKLLGENQAITEKTKELEETIKKTRTDLNTIAPIKDKEEKTKENNANKPEKQ